MKCTYCGEDNSDNSKFCQKCGAQLNSKIDSKSESTVKASKKSFLGKFIKIAIVCIAIAIGGTILFNIFKTDESEKRPKNSIASLYKDEQTSILIDTNLLETKIDGNILKTQVNYDGDIVAILTSEYVLYCIDKIDVFKIDEEVKDFTLSPYGDTIVYLSEENTLNLYSYKNKKSSTIANDIYEYSVAVSPDGNTLTYVASDDEDYKLYIYVDGKSTLVGNDLVSISVSNGGEYIYCYNIKTDVLYRTSVGKDKVKLAVNVEPLYVLNKDHSQVMFISDDKNYISIEGSEKKRIGIDSYILPYISNYNCVIGKEIRTVDDGIPINTMSYSVNSLLDNTFLGEDNLLFIDNKCKVTKIISNSWDITDIIKTDDNIFYIESGSLYKTSVKNTSKPIPLLDDVDYFDITSNEEYIYYINSDDELWCKHGKSDSIKIADDVKNMLITDNDILLFISDYSSGSGILYSCNNGKDKNKIADDVYSIGRTANITYYYSNYNDGIYDVYVSMGDTSFKFIMEETNFRPISSYINYLN